MLFRVPLQVLLDNTKIDTSIFRKYIVPFLLNRNKNILPPELTWVAGGYLRRLLTNDCLENDIDIFSRVLSVTECIDAFGNYHFLTKNAYVWKEDEFKKQNISFNYNFMSHLHLNTLEELLTSFDLTIAQFATDGSNLYFTPSAWYDLQKKILVKNMECKLGPTKSRLLKYIQYGYITWSDACYEKVHSNIETSDYKGNDE